MDETIPQGSWWARNWKWFVPVGCLSLLATCGCCIGGGFFMATRGMQGSRAYVEALERVKADPDVQAALGTPIEAGWMVQFNTSIQSDGTTTRARIPLKGPKGEGSLHIVAHEKGKDLTYEQLDVIAGTQVIHLVEGSPFSLGKEPGDPLPPGQEDLDWVPGAPKSLRDFDLPGADASKCTLECVQDPKCKAYLFVKSSSAGKPGRCHLLDGPMDEVPPGTLYGVVKQ